MSVEATVVDVGVSDAELFNDAAAETTVETPEVQVEAPQIETTAQPRDEAGKFAKAETTQTEPTTAQTAVDDDKGGLVPSWRVREINAEKAELAAKLATAEAERQQWRQQLENFQRQQRPAEQPKKEMPDPLLDPEGYRESIRAEMREDLLNDRRETSLRTAHRSYKGDFDEAYSAAKQEMAKGNHALAVRMQQSSDPGETLMEWHREQKTMREVGTDPNAWLEKKLEERMNDPAFLAKAIEKARGVASTTQTNGSRPAVNLPPSLSSMSRADNSHASSDDNDVSDEALFKHAIR